MMEDIYCLIAKTERDGVMELTAIEIDTRKMDEINWRLGSPGWLIAVKDGIEYHVVEDTCEWFFEQLLA